jgi:hypothetical protein
VTAENMSNPAQKNDHMVSVIDVKPPRIIRKRKIKVVITNTSVPAELSKAINKSEFDDGPREFDDVATSDIGPNVSSRTEAPGRRLNNNTMFKEILRLISD